MKRSDSLLRLTLKTQLILPWRGFVIPVNCIRAGEFKNAFIAWDFRQEAAQVVVELRQGEPSKCVKKGVFQHLHWKPQAGP